MESRHTTCGHFVGARGVLVRYLSGPSQTHLLGMKWQQDRTKDNKTNSYMYIYIYYIYIYILAVKAGRTSQHSPLEPGNRFVSFVRACSAIHVMFAPWRWYPSSLCMFYL